MTNSINFWIDKINFKNGTNITLKKDSIVVFVGSNNSGKSLILKEIHDMSYHHNTSSIIVDTVEICVEGSSDDFISRIEHRRKGATYHYHSNDNTGMGENSLKEYWDSALNKKSKSGAPAISNFFIKKLDTIARRSLVNPAGNIDIMTELKTHPIHELKKDSNKEKLFSGYFKIAFGEDAIINHSYGAMVPLHIGVPPLATKENDRVSSIYQSQLRQLPFLHEQGDGMKSFAGVFLSLFAEDFTVNLIDEPEAFLHPPQSALLGQMMTQKLNNNKQIFAATHSEHFLKGLLDNAADRLIIVRIQRAGNTNKINILKNQEINKFWSDTLLRHSNVLDGLFHKKVVVTESDSDCRFYNAFTTALIEQNQLPSPDILFVSSGGKERFPVIIRALRILEVPLKIIGDFDWYHNENPLRKTYEELDGNWNDIKTDFYKVKKSIDEKISGLKTEDLKIEIEQIFSSINDKIMPENKIKNIQASLKKASPWRQAKASGKSYLPSGEQTAAFIRIQLKLAEKNIHILELGEIEAFDKSVGGHGPKWVNEVLSKNITKAPELEEARTFVMNKILDFV
nr:AAA family ATPase [uncultured Flavobacterium sp.]